jgi:hypothetical protein
VSSLFHYFSFLSKNGFAMLQGHGDFFSKTRGTRAKTLQKGAPKAGGNPHAPAKRGIRIASKITHCAKTNTYATEKLISKLFWTPVIILIKSVHDLM